MIDHFDTRPSFLNRALPNRRTRTPKVTLTTQKVRVPILFLVPRQMVITSAIDLLRDLFLVYPRMEQALLGNIRGADFGSCLKASEFQFKKKRIMFLHLLNQDSQDAKGLSANSDLTRSVANAVLGQQDEKSALAALETFGQDDQGIFSWLPSLFRTSRGKEGLWESASRRALSVSDSQFLSELKTIPADHYLHEATNDVEGTAYALLTKQVDTLVSRVSRQILSTQIKECDKQVQREVDTEEAREVHTLWSSFVRQVKDVSALRSTSYVSYRIRNGLMT